VRFGYFPYAWKSAKFIPILNRDKPPPDGGSHRPISLLININKLLERVVANRINSFIHQNLLRLPENFGFRKQHSTTSELAIIADFIIHGFNLRKHTGMVLLGIETANCAVRLNGLLFELIISLHLSDYLLFSLSRTWKVVHLLSNWMTLAPPQSRTIDCTILPLSFWHATPPAHTLHLTRRCYCPSISVLAAWYYTTQNQSRSNDPTQIIHYMETLSKYPRNWNHSIFQSLSPRPYWNPGHLVPCASTVRYFRFMLDSKHLSARHLHTVANKATAALCNIFSLVARDSTLTQSNKLTHYKLLIRSALTYAAPVCNSTYPSNYLRDQVIQSKCLRVIGNHPRRKPTSHCTTH
jgi:hypothetical protein